MAIQESRPVITGEAELEAQAFIDPELLEIGNRALKKLRAQGHSGYVGPGGSELAREATPENGNVVPIHPATSVDHEAHAQTLSASLDPELLAIGTKALKKLRAHGESGFIGQARAQTVSEVTEDIPHSALKPELEVELEPEPEAEDNVGLETEFELGPNDVNVDGEPQTLDEAIVCLQSNVLKEARRGRLATMGAKANLQSSQMIFRFDYAGKKRTLTIGSKAFSEMSLELKALLGVIQASQFRQSDEHYNEYLMRMVNKGLATEKQVNEQGLASLLHGLVDRDYCSNGGPRHRPTPQAYRLFIEQTQGAELQLPDIQEVTPAEEETLPEPAEAHYALAQINQDSGAENAPPPFANERPAATFHAGQYVYLLAGRRLVLAKVKQAEAYKHVLATGPELSYDATKSDADRKKKERLDQEMELRQQMLAERQAELLSRKVEPVLMPDPEELRLKLLLKPRLQLLVPNPSPGWLQLTWPENPAGIITDMHHNYIIPFDAWERIRTDDAYRQAWIEHGSVESAARKDILTRAIATQLNREASYEASDDVDVVLHA